MGCTNLLHSTCTVFVQARDHRRPISSQRGPLDDDPSDGRSETCASGALCPNGKFTPASLLFVILSRLWRGCELDSALEQPNFFTYLI